ncbi:uncharacterized protein PADG_04389 [Paracoccidioides brasiliensis Pb18]|uniref:Uncharacterized protein n=1 Tax=Paracoccidioides brasiliensis (strain Pb18) TaxID=502780 RepID=C1GAV3_PARBD|nr:uncharacterized protein PADG_04389 [Paracoccidioides brasiliensis Pb18]EEH48305.2 hypothetical protein PADG_04389 [Paracoccidioides brasiliensis Pb18]
MVSGDMVVELERLHTYARLQLLVRDFVHAEPEYEKKHPKGPQWSRPGLKEMKDADSIPVGWAQSQPSGKVYWSRGH